jgi:hypothetical protein
MLESIISPSHASEVNAYMSFGLVLSDWTLLIYSLDHMVQFEKLLCIYLQPAAPWKNTSKFLI